MIGVALLLVSAQLGLATRLTPNMGGVGGISGVGLLAEHETDDWTGYPDLALTCQQAATPMSIIVTAVLALPGDALLLRARAVDVPNGFVEVSTTGFPPRAEAHVVSPDSCPHAIVIGEHVQARVLYALAVE